MNKYLMKMLRKLKTCVPDEAVTVLSGLLDEKYYRHMEQKYMRIMPYQPGRYPMGINLIGNIRSESGLGESMRILARIFKENQIPFAIIYADDGSNADNGVQEWDSYIAREPKYAINLIHINAKGWAKNYSEFPDAFLNYRYNVAYWLWEMETFPKFWRRCLKTVDAVWAPSEFICRCIRKYTNKPVVHVPYAIWLQTPVMYTRADFNLPEDQFLYLVMYDFRSISERKNPKGAIEAFKKAFSAQYANSHKIGLVLKVNNAATGREIASLKKQLKGYQNIYFITENLTRPQVESLVALVDVLISLHRSEGFGLPIAEAMFLGTPTVATNWSANTEFMTEQSGCLVDGHFVYLTRQIGPYSKGNRWMDADTEKAAQCIRRLYEDPQYYQSIRDNGKQQIRETLNYQLSGQILQEQMSQRMSGQAADIKKRGKKMEIDVEQIMEEIRADIKRKGYQASDLKFENVKIAPEDYIRVRIFSIRRILKRIAFYLFHILYNKIYYRLIRPWFRPLYRTIWKKVTRKR